MEQNPRELQLKTKSAQKMSSTPGDREIIAKVRESSNLQFIRLIDELADMLCNSGRHALAVTPEAHKNAKYITPAPTNKPKEILKGIWRMFSTYPYWDVSYLVAIIFTLGSVVWCINAIFVWVPLQVPSSEFPGEIANGGGITAFIGATIFEIGSVLLMIEAVNENRADCFGWAVEEVLEERGMMRLRPSHECAHHHGNRHNLVGKGKGRALEGGLYISSPFTLFT
jgi:hypothetical protein